MVVGFIVIHFIIICDHTLHTQKQTRARACFREYRSAHKMETIGTMIKFIYNNHKVHNGQRREIKATSERAYKLRRTAPLKREKKKKTHK